MYTEIGKKIRILRKQIDITQAELAEQSGISTAFLGHIERGTRIMSINTFCKIIKALNCTADELLGGITQAGSTGTSREIDSIIADLQALKKRFE